MTASASQTGTRVASVDLIRGAVMILMAIDHVRVFSGLPAGGPTAGIFFTRWVTHFCAPAFIFLAGTSYCLSGRAVGRYGGKDRNAIVPPYHRTAVPPYHLILRGIWLIFLELTFVRLAWTFNFDFMQYEMAGVIWVIGWCMILMAGLVKLPLRWIATLGIGIIATHNAIGPVLGGLFGDNALWKILYLGFFAGPIQLGPAGPNLIVLYSIVPWIGVMAAGFAFGRLLTLEPARRNRLCLQIGLGATALFVVLRASNLYGDPNPWNGGVLGFLSTSKYPASLSFLLMTLGPTIALVPLLERARGAVARWITVFGRVPFFYYLLHIPLIHVLALLVSQIRLGEVSAWLFTNHPMGNPPPPDGYTWSLGLLYLVFAIAIALLYAPCRWFADLKARRSDWWLRFL